MEQLYALLLLNQSGFEHQEDYLALLHRLFLECPERGGILLELEICAEDLKAFASLLNGYWAGRWSMAKRRIWAPSGAKATCSGGSCPPPCSGNSPFEPYVMPTTLYPGGGSANKSRL